VATLSVTVCAGHGQWNTQRGTQHPHTNPHSQLVGVECLLVHPVLVFHSFPTCHIVNAATGRHLIQIKSLMATMNVGGGGKNRDFIMSRNSIAAPLHTTMQVQSSVCSMILFCIICGSHSSVDEDSSLLVCYTELIGKCY
jgi:hypothetical protein